MKTVKIYCDICEKEIPQRGWETEPKKLVIETFCTGKNPMSEVNFNHPQMQHNIFVSDEVCQACMRHISKVIAGTILSLKPKKKQ